MSTTEEYLDGLLQETIGQKESDAKTAQSDITKEEKMQHRRTIIIK